MEKGKNRGESLLEHRYGCHGGRDGKSMPNSSERDVLNHGKWDLAVVCCRKSILILEGDSTCFGKVLEFEHYFEPLSG